MNGIWKIIQTIVQRVRKARATFCINSIVRMDFLEMGDVGKKEHARGDVETQIGRNLRCILRHDPTKHYGLPSSRILHAESRSIGARRVKYMVYCPAAYTDKACLSNSLEPPHGILSLNS